MGEIKIAEWLLISVTFVGPVAAVQAQKWIERVRDHRTRRMWIFRTLMATRMSRLSFDHVQALNSVDLEYSERRILGVSYHSAADKEVVRAWHQYLDHLNTPTDAATIRAWLDKSDGLFVDLLFSLSRSLGFDFEKVMLARGAYSPRAHGAQEDAQLVIRDNLVKILSGDKAIPVAIVSTPKSTSDHE